MPVVSIIDDIRKWVEDEICSKIQLKVPPDDTEPNDKDYDHTTANPLAFAMYVPTKDKLPPPIKSVYPSVCVGFAKGTDSMDERKGSIGIQLSFSAWNPGIHGTDMLIPQGDGKYRVWSGPEANDYFQRYGEGWRDVWNFVDIARRALESTTDIKGHYIDMSTPIEFGPLITQEAIADFYPFWFAWMTFQIKYPLLRHIEENEEFL